MKAMHGCGFVAACWLTAAVATPANAAPAPTDSASTAIGERIFLSPMARYTLADSGRLTDDGLGGSLSVGRIVSERLFAELSGQYGVFGHEQGSGSAKIAGLTANALFFPTARSAYALVGLGYGSVRSQPCLDASYGSALLNLGAGYWWAPWTSSDIVVRSQVTWQLDAHNDRRTGDSLGNGRKAFNDFVFSVGLVIPLGKTAVVEPAPAAPVEVVPVAEAAAEPAAEAVAAAPPCRTPEAGQKIDFAGCAAGDIIVLRGVNFDFDKATLTVNAKTLLDDVADSLQRVPSLNFEIGGHTDARGSEPYNLGLSLRRARSVADYLQARGIEPSRMHTEGYGETMPVADNATDEGRELNRRVEIKIAGGADSAAIPADAAAPSDSTAAPDDAAGTTTEPATPETTDSADTANAPG
ncbi:OmpA family protein [Hydrocarboniphaga sp.]|uniref:OmpA family protein n=1 Tax=Hydrocarboniphaga sp. TaxID=2033016 RepID=UPI003D0EBA03